MRAKAEPSGSIELFGAMPGGTPVHRIWLTNALGMRAGVITLGASLQTLTAPDAHGALDDIVLGHDDLAPYVETPSYMGAIVGRFANRIAHGTFELEGERCYLSRNDGDNTLHGGARGFDKAVWRIAHLGRTSLAMAHASPDGDQGFPGVLNALVTYRLSENAPELSIDIEARTSAPTVVSLTSHAFFNLAGAYSGHDILDHRLLICADAYTPVDANLIPTGELRPIAGGPFDFQEANAIAAHVDDLREEQIRLAKGYDHNFALRAADRIRPRLAARLTDPKSGRTMALLTNAPGLQLYSGNFLDATLIGKGGVSYGRRYGLCLEPQHFPDSPNKPALPSARLDPGQTFRQTSLYRFSA
jgi:aldose 1-epimerase